MSRPYSNDPSERDHEEVCPLCGGTTFVTWCAADTLEALQGGDETCEPRIIGKCAPCPCGDGSVVIGDSCDAAETLDAVREMYRIQVAGRALHELEVRTAKAWAASEDMAITDTVTVDFRSLNDHATRVDWLEAVAAYEAAIESEVLPAHP